METMKLRQFKKYCDSKQFRGITLHHKNQAWETVDNPLKYQLSFRNIMVFVAPDVGSICLGKGGNLVYFERVKYVMVDEESSVLGTVIRVVCGDSQSDRKNIQYTLVAN